MGFVDRYDSIIIGAGHNGLVCATYLARSGQKVLVLEAADNCGGLAANREFHPGFNTAIAQTVTHLSSKVCNDLKLAHHGLKSTAAMKTIGLSKDQAHVSYVADQLDGTCDSDATSFRQLRQRLRKFAAVLRPSWLRTMPRIGASSLSELLTFGKIGLGLRLLGKKDMGEFLRIVSLPARDLMDENFDSELLKATLSWDALVGARLAPRSPNGAILAMLYRMSGDSEGDPMIPVGGTAGLAAALVSAAISEGVEIRTASAVERILIDASENGLTANGVQLADGATIHADNVISSADPKRTFLNLVGVEYFDIGFSNRIRRLRCKGYVAKLHLALKSAPQFSGLKKADGRMIIAPTMDHIEFAYDHAKYGEYSNTPVMEVVVPSLHDPALAPTGQHVLSANVMYVPYDLKGGWSDDAREQLLQKTIEALEEYAPGINDLVLHAELLTPADIEKEYRVTGGHWHHAELSFDQMLMMRPTYGAAQYSTPIPGLYLCGAGSHPGGGLMGAAGHNAAAEVLK